MGAHPLEADVPVEPLGDRVAGRGQGRALGGDVHDRLAVGVIDGVDDRNCDAVGADEFAAIAGLPAALGVEQRRVEHDAAGRGFEHAGRRLAAVGVITK